VVWVAFRPPKPRIGKLQTDRSVSKSFDLSFSIRGFCVSTELILIGVVQKSVGESIDRNKAAISKRIRTSEGGGRVPFSLLSGLAFGQRIGKSWGEPGRRSQKMSLENFTALPHERAGSPDALLESHRLLKRQAISRMLWPQQPHLPTHRKRAARFEGRRVASRAAAATTTLGLMMALSATTTSAQVLLLPEDIGPPNYRVSSLELEYASEHPDQPSLAGLLPIVVQLRETKFGWAAPRSDQAGRRFEIGGASSDTIRLEASGLARVMRGIVAALLEEGLYGVDVRPSPRDIDLETERDLRPTDQTSLAVIIHVGRIRQIRTIAGGGRIDSDWKIDNEAHTQILEGSPLQPTGSVGADTTDLLDRRELEDYLYRLNRHSGRRVEAALSPAEEPGGIVLDFRVLESKPWYVYAQGSNTGTYRTTDWQSRVGFSHRQVTGRDDVFSFEYLNAGGDGVNHVRLQYQAPFFGPKRPVWMNRRKGDPSFFDWIPREKIPWWGVDRLRWEADFSWGKSRADRNSFNLANEVVTSKQFQYGGRFIYEVFQYRDFFIDFSAGARIRDIRVRNQVSGSETDDAIFFIPNAGIHAERINQLSTLNLNVFVRGSSSSIDEADLDSLGRDETDDKYMIIDFDLGYSAFLEPLLFPKAWRDPSTELTSTLAHELAFGVRGQYAFDYRLIPQVSFPIGGLYSVRGYEQSSAVGDTVIIASLEYRFHIPRALPVARQPMEIPLLGDFRAAPQQVYGRPDWDLIFSAFVDFGRSIRNDGSNTGAGVNEFDQTLVGAGVGAELQIKSNFTARIDWATALKSTTGDIVNSSDVGDSEVYVLFSILY
jgi:hemolysin activation/secretion protein